jgi:hypothetical protein
MSVPGEHVRQSTASLPPELQAIFSQIASRAMDLTGPQGPHGRYEPVPGSRVAGMTPNMQMARDLAAQGAGGSRHFGHASDVIRSALGQKFMGPNVREYMNPYEDQVSNRIAELGNRNFNERILPALSSEFIKAGQHGSGRHQKLAARAARDIQREILAEQGALRHKGYGEAMQAFNWDQARQAQLADMLTKLGISSGASRMANVEALSKTGQTERELAQFEKDIQAEEFKNAKKHDLDMLAFLANIMHNQPFVPSTYDISHVPRPRSSMSGGDYQRAAMSMGAPMIQQMLSQIGRRRFG